MWVWADFRIGMRVASAYPNKCMAKVGYLEQGHLHYIESICYASRCCRGDGFRMFKKLGYGAQELE